MIKQKYSYMQDGTFVTGVQYDENHIPIKVDRESTIQLGTTTGLDYKDNIKNFNSRLGVDTDIKGNANVGASHEHGLLRETVENSVTLVKNDLYQHDKKEILCDIISNKNITLITNHESGGELTYNNSLDIYARANVGLGGKNAKPMPMAEVGIDKRAGDNYENSGWSAKIGGNNKLMIGASFSKYIGKTSKSGVGGEFGVALMPTGPEVIASISFVNNGVRREINLGGMITNALLQNYPGLFMNIYNAVVGQKLPIPEYELMALDEMAKKAPEVKMFDDKSLELTEDGMAVLEKLAKDLKSNENMDVELALSNYYDKGFLNTVRDVFSKDAADKMSDERADIIKDYLTQSGIPESLFVKESELKNDDNDRMKINSHNTNIILSVKGEFNSFDNKRKFNSLRSSPNGESKVKEIQNMPEFIEATKGMSNEEKEALSNIVFSNRYLSKEQIQEVETINKIKKELYDNDITIMDTLKGLSDKQVQEKVQQSEEFKNYINENTDLSDKEKDLIAKHIMSQNKLFSNDGNEKPTIESSIQDYDKNVRSRGYSLEKYKDFETQFLKELGEHNVYKEITKGSSKNELEMMHSYVVNKFFSGDDGANEKTQKTYIDETLNELRNFYSTGETLESSMLNNGDDNNVYCKRRKDELNREMKTNDFYKEQTKNMDKKDIKMLNNALTQDFYNQNNLKLSDELVGKRINDINEYNQHNNNLNTVNNNRDNKNSSNDLNTVDKPENNKELVIAKETLDDFKPNLDNIKEEINGITIEREFLGYSSGPLQPQ